ncbi:three-Cys-motif partner protein TcmP [Halomonas cerina]|uniref:Three-Cys-motif partner protein n=1 Tax=Halomonas cerina TaxID=447424 RepID=A0A839VHI3_9GAMM|nr:three-Cys-motif partner protein [Halomonas cerina]
MTDNHQFGGAWTAKKLDILKRYLDFYSTALKNQNFNLHYVDPFSGTGTIDSAGELITSEPIEGSAAISLGVNNPFYKYHFNEPNAERRARLEAIVNQHTGRNVSISAADANTMIRNVCGELLQRRGERAVFFIDPFGCQLDWESLKLISSIRGNDVWIWFPVSAVIRQTPREHSKIQDGWRNRLNKLFGGNEWEQTIYQASQATQETDLFGEPVEEKLTRESGTRALDMFVTSKLNEIFKYVHPYPVPFYNTNNSLLFNLYFAMSNDSEKAIGLAQRGINHILKRR